MEAYMIPVITNPFYDLALWMDKEIERKKIVKLNKDSNKEAVQLFLSTILGYNDIDINREFDVVIKDMMRETEIAISGGILFCNMEDEIPPSCCCGLEGWKEIVDSIEKGESPWLGHDPYPTIEYLENVIRVWSDDHIEKWNVVSKEDKESFYYIEYSKDMIHTVIRDFEKDLNEFAIGPMKTWMKNKDEHLAEEFVKKIHEWFEIRM